MIHQVFATILTKSKAAGEAFFFFSARHFAIQAWALACPESSCCTGPGPERGRFTCAVRGALGVFCIVAYMFVVVFVYTGIRVWVCRLARRDIDASAF